MVEALNTFNGYVWSLPLVLLCLGAGLLFTFVTRFLQVRHLPHMLQLIRGGKKSSAGISSFQALAVSLSGRVGTGNIAGVATAIGFGGPGAVFWMWIVAFFGAASAYIEATLGQIYKEKEDGLYRGGPAFYIEKAMGQNWYAILFAIVTIVAVGVLLPTVQANAISTSTEIALGGERILDTFFGPVSTTKLYAAIGVVVIFAAIIFGGVKRIALVTQFVVPFMALAYILSAVIIVILNIGALPGVITLIVSDAFNPMAGVGAAIGWGVKRGIYSNEAGQGTAPHAAAAAEVDHPAQQGLVQAFSVYVDTLLVCSSTAFIILITGMYNVHGSGDTFLVQNLAATVDANSPAFTQLAVESVLPALGRPFIAIALFFFAFTTLLAYYYIAETNLAYLRRYFKIPLDMLALKIAMVFAVFFGAVRTAANAWTMGDIGVGMMAWLNIIAILIIFIARKPAILALRDYEAQLKGGVTKHTFDPEKLGIKNADFWSNKNQ